MWRALGRFERFDIARDHTAGHSGRQKLSHEAKSPAFIAAHGNQRTGQRRLGISGGISFGINGPAFWNAFPCGLGHGDFTQRHSGCRLIELHGNAALAIRHRKGNRVGADDPGFTARRRHNRRGIGQPKPDQPSAGNVFGKIPKRGTGVRMAHSKACHAQFLRRLNRHGQPPPKSRLGKSHFGIHMHRPRPRRRHYRFGRAINPPALQLQAIAFKIVQSANPISDAFCCGHSISDMIGYPIRCTMGL